MGLQGPTNSMIVMRLYTRGGKEVHFLSPHMDNSHDDPVHPGEDPHSHWSISFSSLVSHPVMVLILSRPLRIV